MMKIDDIKIGDIVVVQSYKQCSEGNGISTDNCKCRIVSKKDSDGNWINHVHASGICDNEADFIVKVVLNFGSIFRKIKFSHIISIEKSKPDNLVVITQSELKEIYDIACTKWKTIIKELSNKYGDFHQVKLPVFEVDVMLKSCTTDQLPIVSRIFSNYIKNKKKDYLKCIKSWEDLTVISGYYIDNDSNIINVKGCLADSNRKNIFATKKQAENVLAMAQLSQLMKDLGSECDINWDNDYPKYTIIQYKDKVIPETFITTYQFLAFKSKNVRDKFLENHIKLIEQYFMKD